jgi:hypothetical protein
MPTSQQRVLTEGEDRIVASFKKLTTPEQHPRATESNRKAVVGISGTACLGCREETIISSGRWSQA